MSQPPERTLSDGGLSTALLTLDDLGDGWVEPLTEPPLNSSSHFACMPLYFDDAIREGVAAEFSAADPDVEYQPPNVSQLIVRYPDGEAAMEQAADALDICLERSSVGLLGEPSTRSIEGLGQENLIVESTGEIEGMIADSSGQEEFVSQELNWRGAYLRRGDLIALLMFLEVEEDEFERLLRVADARLQRLD